MVGRDVVVAGVDVADLLGAQGGGHGAAPYTRAPCPCPAACAISARPSVTSTLYEQRDQPAGVPPLALTGERTLPDVPEENYWFRRHLAVYEWIAARVARAARDRHGLRRGLRLGRARRAAAASVVGVDANPEAHEHARLRYRRANLRFERDLVETLHRAGRRGRVPADDRARPGPGRGARALPLARRRRRAGDRVRSTPNVLTLAPEGAPALGQPVAHARVPRRGVRAALPRHFGSVAMFGLFHARKLRAHELALRAGWDAVHARLRPDQALLRLVHAGDRGRATSSCAARRRPTSSGRWTSSRCAGP